VDLFEKELHWHKVRAMISGLHGTMLNEIMSYRCAKDSKNTELMRMKRIWALPEKVSEEEKEKIAAFHAQFK
ncbi:MAG: Gp15 family bacteriophage protein, partial [Bacteroidales bacterium]